MSDLLPCPFCGKQPQAQFYGDEDDGYFGVLCCQAFAHERDEETAVRVWNTRAPTPDHMGGLVETVKDFIGQRGHFDWCERATLKRWSGGALPDCDCGYAEAITALERTPSGWQEVVEALEPFVRLADRRDKRYRERGGEPNDFPDSHPAYDISAYELRMGAWRRARAALASLPPLTGEGKDG